MNKFIIICGLSFSGKTTLSKVIASRFGFNEIDVDEVKDQLFGVGVKDEDLKHEDWVNLYNQTNQQIEKLLQSGKTVIDASRNFKKAERELAKEIAQKASTELVTIFVDTPEKIVRQRWQENRENKTRHDVSDKGFEDIIQVMEPPTIDEKALIFKYGEKAEEWITKHQEVIG